MAKVKAAKKTVADQEETLPSPFNETDVPSIYSNAFQLLSMNFIDVRIAFNEIIVDSGSKPRVQRRANIVMPVASFLTMVRMLSVNAQHLQADQERQSRAANAKIDALIESAQSRPAK